MRSSTQLWRDAKTLVVLEKNADAAVPWDRWDTCCCGYDDYVTLRTKKIPVHIPIFTTPEPSMTLAEFRTISATSKIVVISLELIKSLGETEFRNGEPLKNLVCLEEFERLYAYCGAAWDGTSEDAVTLTAMILHYTRIVSGNQAIMAISPERRQRRTEMGITVTDTPNRPPEIWLITQFFRSEKARRTREIRACLEKNVACPYIDKILLLNEADYTREMGAAASALKVVQKIVGKRLTYDDVFREILTLPKEVIVVFANSDIYFDESLRLLESIHLEDKFLSLLRWETAEGVEPKLFGPRDDSQDAWILTAASVQKRTWDWKTLSFPFGKNGCDNAVNVEMLRQKFLVVNPAHSIRAYHIHTSQVRTYDPKDVLDKPIFLYVAPTGIHDLRIQERFEPYNILQQRSHRTVHRPFRTVQQEEGKTFCTMITRQPEKEYEYELNAPNIAQPATDTILKVKDCFMTSNGLVFDHTTMFIGGTEASQRLWGSTPIHGALPTISTELALSVPLTEKETATQEEFCLRYLAKILQMRIMSGEFLCPNSKSFLEILQLFRWSTPQVPVLEQKTDISTYCKNAIVWVASENEQPTCEDIQALRGAFALRCDTPAPKKVVIVEDGIYVDLEWTAQLEEKLGDAWDTHVIWPERTEPSRIADLLKNTEYLIFANSPKLKRAGWRWMWMLPPGAHTIEIQHELFTCGDGLHLAGACGLDSWLVIMKKGMADYMRNESIKSVLETMAAVTATAATAPPESVVPTVWIPRPDIQGFFSHTGDTFREMVEMWAERGYCTRKEHPTATMVWWGAVGDTLLYDRPTLNWLTAAPALEQTWKRALFGNPEPSGSHSSVWSFWGRRPRLLEAAAATCRGWTEREQTLVFYGKIENSVQASHRAEDWLKVCSDSSMVQGEKTAYRFSQKEYLERLGAAKFGLCLAGFGRKCNREIECMALGTVPVVSAEVDMDGYLHPPIVGVHYLRAATPAAAAAAVAAVSREKWTEMSVACHEWWVANASCEGLWRLTAAAAVSVSNSSK